jgi:uncharacterized membrane protein
MRYAIFIAAVFLFFINVSITPSNAQSDSSQSAIPALPLSIEEQQRESYEAYSRAKVTEIIAQGTRELHGIEYPYQTVTLTIVSGEERGKEVKIRHGDNYQLKKNDYVKEDEIVVLSKPTTGNPNLYIIVDKYRLPSVAYIFLFFLVLVVFFARRKGVGSILGLAISFAILMFFIVPRIAAGDNPLIIILIGSIAITTITLFLAHGISKRTGIAYISTVITLLLAGIFAYSFILVTRLSGMGSEDAYTLQTGPFAQLNFQGLLLGSIIIGVLGVLDDITTAQSAVVDELKKANPLLKAGELYEKGLSVGQEHIASLVNTLILVYAGSAFPVLLTFTIVSKYQPLWVTLNSQFIVEEIVRSLVGSVALILAVPITTILASWHFGKNTVEESGKTLKKKKLIRQ